MAKTLPISAVRTHLFELITGVAERGEEIVVTRQGRSIAVLVNYKKYLWQQELLDIFSDPNMMKQIRPSRRFYARAAKGLSFEGVLGKPLVASGESSR